MKVSIDIPRAQPGTRVKITIAGARDKVAQAKEVIREITEVYYSALTHPGYTHAELEVPERLYNIIIGPKGSEIRHIENNFKVDVYIPSVDTVNKNVLVVGRPEGVTAAERYIGKLVSQAGQAEATHEEEVMRGWRGVGAGGAGPQGSARATASSTGASAGRSKDPNEVVEEEDWMKEYMYERRGNGAVVVDIPTSAAALEGVQDTGVEQPAVAYDDTEDPGAEAEIESDGPSVPQAQATTTWSSIAAADGW